MKLYLICLLLLSQLSLADEKFPPLVVGMELSYPPFETVDPYGHPKGISVAIANALAHYLGRPLKIENIPFIGLIPALKTHKIDLIISSMTATPEREKVIAFSEPYLKMGLGLLVNIDSTIQNIQEADQIGRKIVVKQGTTGEAYARDHLFLPDVYVLDRESACVLEIVQNKADAFIYDQFSIFTNWQKNRETTRAILTPFKIENWAIGMRKSDEQLLSQVNNFLVKFRQDNGFEAIGDQYLSEQKAAFKKLGIPFFL